MSDKGDGTDSETGGQEDDFLHDELFRSRLGTIKRVWLFLIVLFSFYLFFCLVRELTLPCALNFQFILGGGDDYA